MAQPDRAGEGFWRTLPGVLTAIAGFMTALTGLAVAAAQIGIIGGESSSGEPRQTRSAAAPEVVGSGDELPDVQVNADRIAGRWIGTVSRGHGTTFVLRMSIAKGCAPNERCGSISVSDVPCKGDVFLDKVNEGTYEMSVDNFSPGSSASCRSGAGDYFTPQRNGTLRYRAGYDGAIAGTLSRAPE